MTGLDGNSNSTTHELSLDNISCTSDFERQSLDFDRHSSEEELSVINTHREGSAEKRKWSQVSSNRNDCCDSAASSDEEVKDLMLKPQPIMFSSSPPKGVQKVSNHHHHHHHHHHRSSPPRIFLARVTPITVSSVSPRKRHRQTTTSDSRAEGPAAAVMRPCLDFEKMQVGFKFYV
jgi:hypothetical protein